jgi:hypothetical protein
MPHNGLFLALFNCGDAETSETGVSEEPTFSNTSKRQIPRKGPFYSPTVGTFVGMLFHNGAQSLRNAYQYRRSNTGDIIAAGSGTK